MSEKIFSAALCLLAIIAVALLPGAALPAAEIMALKLMYVAMLLAMTFALVYVFRGTKYDFYDEIILQHNIAGALFLSAIIISIAMVIGGK